MISNDPSDTLEASGTIELGSYHLLRGTGAVNSPLSDNSALRLAFQHYERDAYLTDGSGAENSTEPAVSSISISRVTPYVCWLGLNCQSDRALKVNIDVTVGEGWRCPARPITS